MACTVPPSTLPTDSVDRAASRFLCPCNAGSRPRVPSRSFLLPNARDTSDHRHVLQPAAKCDGDPRTSFQFFVSRSDRSGRSNRGKRLGLAPLALYSPVIRLQSRRAMPPMRPCQPLAPCLPATGKTGVWRTDHIARGLHEGLFRFPGIQVVREDVRAAHSQVLQDVPRRIDKTFQAFFLRCQRGQVPGFRRLWLVPP